MKNRSALFIAVVALVTVNANAQNPLAIPPAIELDTFDLTLDESTHEFYPGVVTQTYGINAPYLGPTLILHKGDTARFRIHNQLAEISGMHWNGMEVPPVFDGSPPRVIEPGDTWNVKYKVIDKASVYLYHPHTMDLIGAQVGKGAAGLIIVRDDEEDQLALPRNYGVDDFPLAVQDKKFSPTGQLVSSPYGDSILVNGTAHPYLDCPAQVVRLRLLNASTARYYPFGFEGNVPFQVIASEGGLLDAPVTMDRIMLSSGERVELLLDLTGMEGDSLLLMSYGSELPMTMPGSNNLLWESSSLNGIDFPILRIRVGQPTADPITTIPATLANVQPYPEASAALTRIKEITGNGMVGGMSMFMLNGQGWDMDAINDTIMLGDTEIWTYINHSNMAHPMTMHGGSFFVLDRNGMPPMEWEQGPKSVVNVDVGDTVRVIMRFAEYTTDGWPLMYHCHNLMHINHMMWQFIIVDMTVPTTEIDHVQKPLVYPVPSSSLVRFINTFPVMQVRVMDLSGREVMRTNGPKAAEGTIDIASLLPGNYIAVFMGLGNQAQAMVVRE
ncbi:MAG: multicopper oxidase domain-containing protein [Flavobacteriales bacterium]|nr:multicopper oxidase domain-containing protein [Flavobacteriales bacterium]MBK6944282.1 multicopper oxidase domain-containing protein [Flavobacteriales bacterium]MBK7240483.1 multicopper oxidase domain-containing protein [Flavobacteriales bacterium]MBK7295220.1 multicopper oxidase domain-containing protein [Flavobacteriales bacterium]MBK9533950.1 multicopper oxidase domain-containing protein [Flavobacteriales bacterium]